MAAKTAVEVAEMESELYLLRREKAQYETQIALLTQERDACKVELAMASARAREEMMKSTQLETIISQTSMGLVSALRSYHQQRQAERSARQAAQEREMGVGDEDTPTFLARRQEQREAADEALSQLSPVHREEVHHEPPLRTAPTDRQFMRGARFEDRTFDNRGEIAQARVMETKMTGRAPRPSHEAMTGQLRRAAEEVARPATPAPRKEVDDHPLLPPLEGIGGPERGDLSSMMRRTQEHY